MKYVLCKGRHEVKHDGKIIEDFIFPGVIENPMDFAALEVTAHEVLKNRIDLVFNGLEIFVTGLTPALIATLNMARALKISVLLWHYDIATGTYKSQSVRR